MDAVVAWIKRYRTDISQHDIWMDRRVEIGDVEALHLVPPGGGALCIVGALAAGVNIGLVPIAVNIHIGQTITGAFDVEAFSGEVPLAISPFIGGALLVVEPALQQIGAGAGTRIPD